MLPGGERPGGDGATIDIQIAAIGHLIHAAHARGVDNALPELLKSGLVSFGDAGYSAVVRAQRLGCPVAVRLRQARHARAREVLAVPPAAVHRRP
ncbi:hypothetical protein ACFUN8_05855 [Streptomyces sp. NPDC057307]|uniref:imine reductase family protein n=1 Tax=Streptomyces sp. NPDC057307 TaxID=3346096 RepID=UPI003632C3BE